MGLHLDDMSELDLLKRDNERLEEVVEQAGDLEVKQAQRIAEYKRQTSKLVKLVEKLQQQVSIANKTNKDLQKMIMEDRST